MIREEDLTTVALRIVECLMTVYELANEELEKQLHLPDGLFAVLVKEKVSYVSGVKVGAIVMMAPLFAVENKDKSQDDILTVIDEKVCEIFESRVRKYAKEMARESGIDEIVLPSTSWYSGEWIRRSH